MRAGAVFLGVGTSLLDKNLIANSNWDALKIRALQFKAEVEKGREGISGWN